EAARLVQETAHPEANIIFGTVIDAAHRDEVRVPVIAAGFESNDGPAGRAARAAKESAAAAAAPAAVRTAPTPAVVEPPAQDVPAEPVAPEPVAAVENESSPETVEVPRIVEEAPLRRPTPDDLDIPD